MFHKTLRLLRKGGLEGEKILVGISGGLDSITLLDVLSQAAPIQKLELAGIHADHGDSPDPALAALRKQAKKLANDFCGERSIPCIFPPPPKKILKSEAEFREFRRALFFRFLKEEGASRIALAHNSQDLLETRLIHLIRGCGAKGLSAMESAEPVFLRPFLLASRGEIKSHAQSRGLKWLDDPSNSDESFLRNWIRQSWLPALEAKRPGAVQTLSRSLSLIASDFNDSHSSWFSAPRPRPGFWRRLRERLPRSRPAEESFASLIGKGGINLALFRELSLSEQKKALAFYMRKKSLRGYGQSHIEEILKRLQRRETSFSFRMLKKTWRLSDQRLRAED